MSSSLTKIHSSVSLALAIGLGGAFLPAPADATEGLAVGACVTVQGSPAPGRIIALTPGGYVVQAEGKAAGEAMNWTRTRVAPGPCPAPPTPAQLAEPHACFPSD